MHVRKLNTVVFFVVTLIVFLCGTTFTILSRYDFEKSITYKGNLLAICAGTFLTVGECALIALHRLLDAKELWRRIAAYTLSLLMISTISFATYTEAKAYMSDRSVGSKKEILAETTQKNAELAKTAKERRQAIKSNETLTDKIISEIKAEDFTPFAVNFICGLFCILTASLIQPRQPWTRKRGNQMTPELKAKAEKKIGFVLPDGATAYEDGKGSSLIVKNGRTYLGTVPKD